MERAEILKQLRATINVNGHLIGAVCGSGMMAKYTMQGGADLLLALAAGKFRLMGRGSYLSYFCYGNNNDTVMELGTRELFPLVKDDIPILFGLLASDPGIHLYEYLKQIKEAGFSGIVNFPTMSLIDGQFREALEEEGNCYATEVEAINLAHHLDMFTLAFVTNEDEARQMLNAGADVICLHLGLTKGGYMGARRYLSMEDSRKLCEKIFAICDEVNPEALRMIYSGPANTPMDMRYIYLNTSCQGYIGGSTFDRIPIERAIVETTSSFKMYGEMEGGAVSKQLEETLKNNDYVKFVCKAVAEHYRSEVHLQDLALVAHVTPSYLSTKFKSEMGISFSKYLVRFRIAKAKELLEEGAMNCREVAENVGYTDYAQFSKIFKKYVGLSPTKYQENIRKRPELPVLSGL